VGAIFILSDNIKSGEEIKALSEADKLSYFASEASAVQMPFIVLAGSLLLLALFIALSKLPKVLEKATTGGYGEALKDRKLLLGALGIFVYVGAEVAIGSYLVNYFMDMGMPEMIKNNDFMSGISSKLLGKELSGVDAKGIVGAFVMFYWTGAMIGRFIGSGLTRIIKPGKVLAFFGLGAITMILISMNTTGFASMWSILAVGLFNSIMFPTIFTIAIEDLGDYKPQGSGILCTAIAGGAFSPPMYGYLTDKMGFKLAFILCIACYAYILWYGWRSRNNVYGES